MARAPAPAYPHKRSGIRGTLTGPGVSKQSAKPRAAFPRSARLLRRADFERVYKLGRRHFSASLTVFYLARREATANCPGDSGIPGLRVGFTVGRALGGAVQRNRIRRRLREAVRLARPPVGPNADVVINPKKLLLTAAFAAVLNEVRRAFVVIEEKLGSKQEGKSTVVNERQNSGNQKPEA